MKSKVYDSYDSFYKSCFGAIKTGEKVMMRVRIPNEFYVNFINLLVCRFNEWDKNEVFKMKYEKSEDDCNVFCGEFVINSPDLYYYMFEVCLDGNIKYIKKQNFNDVVIGNGEGFHFQLTVYDKNFKAPEFMKGAIMYQIFPDRFYKSLKPKKNVPKDRKLRDDWYGIPDYLPNSEGVITNNDYFGGDIQGIIEKIPYLKSLGVNVVYLNPIFEAHSNHRYNTANYMKIDPLLGDEEDFIKLCNELHKNGMYLVLDGVFSHTGSDSIYFNRENRYNNVGAYNSKESKYYPWFKFFSYPDEFKSWWGFDSLPEVDKFNEEYIKYICGDNGVIDKWLKLGADGFRLDVADELPDIFLEKINEISKKYSNKIVIGEVWEDATTKESYGVKRKYLLGKQLDTVMNYPFKDAILSYIRYGNATKFYETVMSIIENYPKESLDTLMNLLSTHDTERALTKLCAEEVGYNGRLWQAYRNRLKENEIDVGIKLLKLATILQYFLPGTPSIYYGDEAGMYGYKDPFNRACYPWNKENEELISFYKDLGKIRNKREYLKEAIFKIVYIDTNVCLIERHFEDKLLLVAINRTNFENKITIPDYYKGHKLVYSLNDSNEEKLNPYGCIIIEK